MTCACSIVTHTMEPCATLSVLLAIYDTLDIETTADAPITAIGDSLALLIVVLAVEETLRVTLEDDVFDARTVRDVVVAVERAMVRRCM